jgi:hypothetical protein
MGKRMRSLWSGVDRTGKAWGTKKPPIHQDGGLRVPGDFGRSTVLKPLHIGPFLDQTTVGISTPGWQRAVSPACIPDAGVEVMPEDRSRATSLCVIA